MYRLKTEQECIDTIGLDWKVRSFTPSDAMLGQELSQASTLSYTLNKHLGVFSWDGARSVLTIFVTNASMDTKEKSKKVRKKICKRKRILSNLQK